MTNYSEIYAKISSKDCTVEELQKIIWKYASEGMMEILKSGKVDVNLVKTLINYRGNSYGAHAMLLDMPPIKSLYEEISWFIYDYATAHENIIDDNCGFSWFMNVYAKAIKAKKDVENEIRNNPMIENLCKNGHSTFAQKAIRFLADGDERTKEAQKDKRHALYEMRAAIFFKLLSNAVDKLGE